jgi:hypothetical protein
VHTENASTYFMIVCVAYEKKDNRAHVYIYIYIYIYGDHKLQHNTTTIAVHALRTE